MLPTCDWDDACLICAAWFAICKHESGFEVKNRAWQCADCGKPASMIEIYEDYEEKKEVY